MKHIKLSFIALIAIGLLAINSLAAQTPAAPPSNGHGGNRFSPEAQLARMTEQFSLTQDQKPKVKAVIEAQTKKMEDLRGETTLTPDERRTKMQDIRKENAALLEKILTPEQFKKFQDHQQRGRNRGPQNPPAK